MINRVLSLVTHSAAFSRFVALLEQADGMRPNLLPILTYHRVDMPDAHPALYPGLISATPAQFDRQMSYLATNYHVVSMAELLHACQAGGSLPPRSVMITFDDAYRDFAEHAWPILKRHRLPVTLFVPTAFPDHPERTFWWDQLYQAVSGTTRRDALDTPLGRLPLATAVQRDETFRRLRDYVKILPYSMAMAWVEQVCSELGSPPPEVTVAAPGTSPGSSKGSGHSVLNWSELHRLAREGVTLAPHSRTHPLLNRIPPEEMRVEVIGSLQDLKREIGPTPPVFAYPSGGFNDEVLRVLEREGFALAFTVVGGINDLRNADRLRLRRINVGRHTTLAVLRARLSPWTMYLTSQKPGFLQKPVSTVPRRGNITYEACDETQE